MKKILISLNSVVYNRGSEALVRGLSKLLKEKYKDSYITLASSENNFGDWLNIENIDNYVKKSNVKRHSIKNYIAFVFRKIPFLKEIGSKLKYSSILKIIKNQDYIYIVGADNYDISYGGQERLLELNTLIRKNTEAKLILYDCSFAKRDITGTLNEDFKNFDCITVREKISYENLDKSVIYVPDPAFVLDKEEVKLPNIFNKNKEVVGINLSNLISNNKYGSKFEEILKSYKNMINYILDATNFNIILIPHVMNNADLSTLRILYSDYSDNDRVELLDNEEYNAKQLKYIISNCSLYVGARTHSTIAAYSTCIPTLVIGYSVKSRGIACDLFGTDDKYVISVEKLSSDENILKDSFIWLLENRVSIKEKLETKIPDYINQVNETIDLIEKKCK